MGFLDALFGRRKQIQPNLDDWFALPSAALELQAATGFTPTGRGAVCFTGVEGGQFARLKQEIRELLDTDTAEGGEPVEYSQDRYGYTWLQVEQPPDDLPALVNDLHTINSMLQDHGWGPQLLCSLVGFTGAEESDEAGRPLGLVYLYKRGTFYPFAPRQADRRDNALELRVQGALEHELPLEADLSRWYPLWNSPALSGP
ncbi:hypothetical protein ACFWW5_30545 [Streptomyces albidoflavus]|uniref:PspA-associated protein PspAB n=1 Tax=Streptomyces TaxID=1883 RepID=UPI00056B0924|nr:MULTISPECIES: hypothetical protein [Streptomyces]MCX4444214.1 hypothetical protein [Streptomyces albidoflavus]RZE51381.1 hypothetical protein C0Q98_29905 [Streptomyces albidoflavus]WTC39195.1 hypothetical protein OH723_29485 [Streptomyces albidoflavus]